MRRAVRLVLSVLLPLLVLLHCGAGLAFAQSPDSVGVPEVGNDPATEESDVADSAPPETELDCQLLYTTTDGLFVDRGFEHGLSKGQTGFLELNGRRLGRIEVSSVARKSSYLRLTRQGDEALTSGDALTLILDTPLQPVGSDSGVDAQQAPRTTFEPLLAQPRMGLVGVTDARNLFSGRLSLRQLHQSTTENDLDYRRTRLSTSGNVQRMDGTPWAFEWSGDLFYRDGSGYEDVDDYQEIDVELYQFSLYRRFEDKGLVRAGRFLARELPAVGYIDGLQGESQVSESVRAGVLFGFKPTRDDLEPTFKELMLAPYATFEAGDGATTRYSLTAGLMATLYEREADRLAILIDQTGRMGNFSLYSSSEIDFDVGGFESRDVARITRWNLSSHWSETWVGTLRAGLDHFELADIEAQRDLVPEIVLDESEYIDNGYWRYWLGATQQLGEHWTITEEVSYTLSDSSDGFRWMAGIARRGLFGVRDASISVDVYNLLGDDVAGYGGRAAAYFPIRQHEIYLQPSVSFRSVEADISSQEFTVTDFALHGHWVLGPNWRATAGVTYGVTDDFDRLLVDVGLVLTW